MHAMPVRAALLLTLMAVLVSVTAAQDAPKADPTVELMKLYREKGRAWTFREIQWHRGGVATEQHVHQRVDWVSAEKITLVTTRVTDNFNSDSVTESFPFTSEQHLHAEWADAKLPTVELKLPFRTFPCKKHRQRVGDVDVTSWVSTEFHPLVVRQSFVGKDRLHTRVLTGFDDTAFDRWLLYRVAGRSWLMQTRYGSTVQYLKNEVTEVAGTRVKVSVTMLDSKRKPIEGVPPVASTIEIDATDFDPVELMPTPTKRVMYKCTAGEFHCDVMNYGDTSYYTSRRWGMLLVGTTGEDSSNDLVEFDLGHNAERFWYAKDNKLVRRITRGQTVTTETIVVTGAEATESTYLTVIHDAKGTEVSRTEGKIALTRPAAPFMPYANQDEVMIELECGKLAAIRTSKDGVVSHHYHGILALSEAPNEHSELIELDME